MWWLDDIIVPAVLILAVCCFVLLVRFQTQRLSRRTDRTAEDWYPRYADSIPKQREYAREHGEQWRNDERQQDTPAKPPADTDNRGA